MTPRGLPEDAEADTEIQGAETPTEIAHGKTIASEPRARGRESVGPDKFLGATLGGRYEITRRIGQGGMGAVYEAKHTQIGKRVAIKVLLEHHAEASQIGARLEQEARLASSIGHPNIIDITDFGETEDGRRYVVMEYLEGESLAQCLEREGVIPALRAIRIARQVASALDAAHEKGVLHRDIKPENVFLLKREGEDFIKVVDFGISKAVDGSEAAEDQRLTQTGMVLGTPLYMSPEQARGEALDIRADVYALGVLLYEMTTGEVPFQGQNYLNVLSQVTGTEAKPPRERNPELSEGLELVILKGIAKDRDERYQNMLELDSDLQALDAGGGRVTSGARLSARKTLRARILGKHRKSPLPWLVLGGLAVFSGLWFANQREEPPASLPAPAAPPRRQVVMTPPPVPEPELASIEIVTIPPGAEIYEGDRKLGTTPYTFEVEATRPPIAITARMEGYVTATATVRPREDNAKQVEVSLTKVEAKPASKPKPPRRRRPRTPAENDLAPLR